MKQIILISFSVVLFSACQKPMDKRPATDDYLQTVKISLKNSFSTGDYLRLDFSNAVLTKVDSASLYLLRIPIKGKNSQSGFVLVKTDAKGKVEKGRVIHLERTNASSEASYDGNISIKDLNDNLITASPIEKGT